MYDAEVFATPASATLAEVYDELDIDSEALAVGAAGSLGAGTSRVASTLGAVTA